MLISLPVDSIPVNRRFVFTYEVPLGEQQYSFYFFLLRGGVRNVNRELVLVKEGVIHNIIHLRYVFYRVPFQEPHIASEF